METPEYLHERVAQLIAIQTDAAFQRCHWVVTLGLKPFRDGDQYCFLWGDNIHTGVAGFGKSIVDAMADFDNAMMEKLPRLL